MGALAGVLRSAGVRLPTALGGPLLGVAAMAASDVPLGALGVSDPRTWSAIDWVSDALPHLVYGLTTHATLTAASAAEEERRTPVRAPASTLLRAAALGAASGSRSTAGVTAVALTSARGDRGRVASGLGSTTGTTVSGVLALGELVADKLPFVPSRLGAPALGGRVLLGGTSAAAEARRDGHDPVLPALVGAAVAVGAAVLGSRLRGVAARAVRIRQARRLSRRRGRRRSRLARSAASGCVIRPTRGAACPVPPGVSSAAAVPRATRACHPASTTPATTGPSCTPRPRPGSTPTAGRSPSRGSSRSPRRGRGPRCTRLPPSRYSGDIHCVTTWSKLGMTFDGVSVDTLLAAARPLPSATHVVAFSHTGYTTNLPLADVTDGKAWVAWDADGKALTAEHGGPARLLVPHLYFWKSAKWVAGLRLLDHDEPGFWERNGYHDRGDPWQEQRYQGD